LTLKEQLEILRGEPIQVYEGDPIDIPCIETSDAEKLCKNPVVSVHMITYNHEPYIRQAIEGVMMQKTDFEFELVIGEDASQDKTREICFEYQKKYPDKIRVLWWHENVSKLGGNSRRNVAHCRGEFVAYCEGDDYWTDSFKLQKQIDLIRKTNSIGCVANYVTLKSEGQIIKNIYKGNGFIEHRDLAHFYPHTATYVICRDYLNRRESIYPNIHKWYDVVLLHCLVESGKVAHLEDVVSVYRLTGSGITTSMSSHRKKIFSIAQYLDLYLNGPKRWRKRFGSLVLTYIAYFFNQSTQGWSQELVNEYSYVLKKIFWKILLRQLFDLRTIRAFMRYLRFRMGFVK
jgi:glycosyltransferase involved in cell wall biosynthesis